MDSGSQSPQKKGVKQFMILGQRKVNRNLADDSIFSPNALLENLLLPFKSSPLGKREFFPLQDGVAINGFKNLL